MLSYINKFSELKFLKEMNGLISQENLYVAVGLNWFNFLSLGLQQRLGTHAIWLPIAVSSVGVPQVEESNKNNALSKGIVLKKAYYNYSCSPD